MGPLIRMAIVLSLGLFLAGCIESGSEGGSGNETGGATQADLDAVHQALYDLDFDTFKGANTQTNNIRTDLELPDSHANGLVYTWISSNTDCLDHNGTVKRPAFTSGSCAVELKAKVVKGGASGNATYNLTVTRQDPTDEEAVAYAKAQLTFAEISGSNNSADEVIFNLNLSTNGGNGVAIAWHSTNAAVNSATGTVTRPAIGAADVTLTLTATLTKGAQSDTKAFNLTVKANDYNLKRTFSGGNHEVFLIEGLAGHDFNLTLELGTAVKDVYLVFSNTAETNATVRPTIATLSGLGEPLYAMGEKSAVVKPDLVPSIAGRTPPVSGKPSVDRFNATPQTLTPKSGIQASMFEGQPALHKDVVGGTGTLNDEEGNPINATVRKVVDTSGKTLNIWVADDMWGSCPKAHCVNQTMIDAVADKFLKAGADNDIYDWVTNIYGAEWGTQPYSNLIAYDGNITIFVFDIDGDNSTTGGVLGFFYARDNFKTSSIATSNQRIMFYLDGVLLATPDGGTWETTDFWPQTLISTLAHEFQHMIHYYQKNILKMAGASTDTWINEMCSLATEDFVAYKLQVDGPRGVPWNTGSAGSATNYYGRLYEYNRYSYVPLVEWMNGSGETSVLNSYAIAYAFGAYLARNYGGPELFRKIVQSQYGDQRAIEEAMTAMGHGGETLSTLIPKWGAANMLSDRTSTASGYRYNQGSFFDYTLDGITYRLGSINLWNYYYQPKIYIILPTTGMAGKYNSSNLYYRVGTNLSGTVKRTFTMPEDGRLTVVVK